MSAGRMGYREYDAIVEYDDGQAMFVGRLAGIRDSVTFKANSVAGLRKAFREAVDGFVESYTRIGKEPPKAWSGNLTLRVGPELHEKATRAAENAGMSFNQWGTELLENALKGKKS